MKKEVEVSDIIEWFVDKGKVRHESDLNEENIKDFLSLHLTGLAEEHEGFKNSIFETFGKFNELE